MSKQDLEHDIIILCLRLLGEDINTFAPETLEVMSRWDDKAKAVLRGEHTYEL